MDFFAERFHVVIILIVVFSAVLAPAVRSDSNAVKLPSYQQENGICSPNFDPNFCPIKCFRPDPVCGVDGVTYWCGCADAYCAGIGVKKLGVCEGGGIGGSGTAGQALLLIHIVWLVLLGVFVLFGLL